jgi:hypothetical protein
MIFRVRVPAIRLLAVETGTSFRLLERAPVLAAVSPASFAEIKIHFKQGRSWQKGSQVLKSFYHGYPSTSIGTVLIKLIGLAWGTYKRHKHI